MIELQSLESGLYNHPTGEPSGSAILLLFAQKKWLPVISDLDHLGLGDFGRLSVISDGDFGFR